MTLGSLVNLVERLNHKQWLVIIETGFGGILVVRTILIPINLMGFREV